MFAKILNEKNIFAKLALMLGTVVGAAIIGYLLLVLVYLIPTNTRMNGHMESAAEKLVDETSYIRFMEQRNSSLDNFTDALMLLTASHENTDNVFESAVNCARYTNADYGPIKVMKRLYIKDETGYGSINYSRYWHGYLVFLKPMLFLFSYGEIRSFIMFLQLGLFAMILVKVKEKKPVMLLPTFLMWIFLNPVATMLSVQYSQVLIATFLMMLFMLTYGDKFRGQNWVWAYAFMIVGCAVAFLDLLTFPLVSLGIPAVLWFALELGRPAGKYASTLEKVLSLVGVSVSWALGYGFMWAMKWVIGAIVCGKGVIDDALFSVQARTSSEAEGVIVGLKDILIKNITASIQYTWVICVIIALVIAVIAFVRGYKVRITGKGSRHEIKRVDALKECIPFLILAVYPLVWYAVLKNHSFIHDFLAFRVLCITFYAFLAWVACQLTFVRHKDR